MRKPSFSIVRDVPGKPLVIRDEGPWDQFPTVTNAAEEAVADLAGRGFLPAGRQLYYYDSEGQLDELKVVNGRFAGFAPGPKGGI